MLHIFILMNYTSPHPGRQTHVAALLPTVFAVIKMMRGEVKRRKPTKRSRVTVTVLNAGVIYFGMALVWIKMEGHSADGSTAEC